MLIPFYGDVQGEAYRRLIDYAMERSAFFVLAKRHSLYLSDSGKLAFAALKPFLIETRDMGEIMPDCAIAYSKGTFYIYRCCSEAGEVLKVTADSLFSWMHPHLPEDLCFWDETEQDFLYNIAHEEMAGMNVDVKEAETLAKFIPGIFFRFSTYKHDDELFINDAIYHQPTKLNIEMYGIQEIPDRISEFKGLKELTIFEQEVRRLPQALFELDKLERLTVYTADLEEIPKDIGKLTRLKHLEICCGSYHSLSDRTSMIPKQEISLKHIPPDIGKLVDLEYLKISYTAITELPDEIESLKKLRFLDFSNNNLRKEPLFLSKMSNLEYINLEKNPFNENE